MKADRHTMKSYFASAPCGAYLVRWTHLFWHAAAAGRVWQHAGAREQRELSSHGVASPASRAQLQQRMSRVCARELDKRRCNHVHVHDSNFFDFE